MMRNIMRTSSAGLVVVLAGALATGCGPKVELPPVHKTSFDYEPRRQGEGAESISIALLEPHWSQAVMDRTQGKFSDEDRAFRDALERALLEYFTVNGFSVSGPFDSLANMTFPEKKQADLVLEVEIDYSIGEVNWQVDAQVVDPLFSGATRYTYAIDDKMSFTGGLSLTLWEPLSGQRMWAKTVSMEDVGVRLRLAETNSEDLVNRVVLNAYRELLNRGFVEVTRQIERYFHPDEVRLVKTQAEELREKKVY